MFDQDQVDGILREWKRERPDLDTSPMGVVGRISRLSRFMDVQLHTVFEAYGIKGGEFDVLATLRRSGEPYQLTPTALFRAVMLTSGSMTNRLDGLEAAGLIRRSANPGDRRSTLVSLTEEGMSLVEEALVAHVKNEHDLLAALTVAERATLAPLLRKLLNHFETREGGG